MLIRYAMLVALAASAVWAVISLSTSGAQLLLADAGQSGQASDVAAAVVFLTSPPAEFITGQTLYVDGGLLSQIPWPYPVERGKV